MHTYTHTYIYISTFLIILNSRLSLLTWVKLVLFFQASSLGLSGVILFGILVANGTIFAFMARPSQSSCYFSIYGFTLSVAIIYAPILVKTNRVYRIFNAGRKGHKKARFIRSKYMFCFTAILISGQVCLWSKVCLKYIMCMF